MDGVDENPAVRDTEPVPRVLKVQAAHVSDAGNIRNLLTEPCGGVSIISCNPGSKRSAHYHLTDAHWLYVVRGTMLYWERPVGSTEPPTEYRVGMGEMIHTGPLVEHWTEFPDGAVLVSMSDRPRDKASHEADVVRVGPRPSDWAAGVDAGEPAPRRPPKMKTVGRCYRGETFYTSYDENEPGAKQEALALLTDAALDEALVKRASERGRA
jgi:hypothetical protein